MKNLTLTSLILTAITAISLASANSVFAETANLNIKMKPLNNTKGNLVYSLYNSEGSYARQTDELQTKTIPVVDAKGADGAAHVKISDLPPGLYAFTVFHDENANNELDKNWLGKPQEMFGISNIERTLWSEPNWDEVSFEIKSGENKELSITLKYQ